ncbi:PD-(D/E)XK motif protein [Priestia megaterium]|uniref:PD-(D/E)XK motif protein n=1 Tax=Priestia megaterium TaxID=1404 RepID=UPI0034581873
MFYDQLTPLDWDDLERRTATNPNMVVNLQIVSEKGEESPYLCIFVASDNNLHFLCEVNESNSQFNSVNHNIAGLELKIIKNHFIIGRERQDYYDLKCTGIHHKEEFTNMIKEICALIFHEKLSTSRAIITIIKRNISFWRFPQNNILSEDKQQGLFGELFVLDKLLAHATSNNVIKKWTGPKGGNHDFNFNNCSIEVKTTLSKKHKHIINGLEQLEQKDNQRTLFVVSLLLTKSDNGRSVSDLVFKIKQKLIEFPNLIEEFNDLLKSYGYNSEHEELYIEFITEDHAVFPVNDEFPTLTTQSLAENLSSRISKINYTLDMEGLYNIKLHDRELIEFIM